MKRKGTGLHRGWVIRIRTHANGTVLPGFSGGRRRSTATTISARSDGFRGITPAVNGDGVALLDEPCEAFWGSGFSWRDPEGTVWDVAQAEGTTLRRT